MEKQIVIQNGSFISYLEANVIKDEAFYESKELTSITIPHRVVKIGNFAFKRCRSLESVVLPDSVLSIGFNAFGGCHTLSTFRIPNKLISIEGYAFYACYMLKSFSIPDTVRYIGARAFSMCHSIESIVIPDRVRRINHGTFELCRNLKHISIPNSVSYVGNQAFWGCSSLESITFPIRLTYLGDSVFQYCYSLASISYRGTMKQWKQVSLGRNWQGHAPAKVIHCIDGDVEIDIYHKYMDIEQNDDMMIRMGRICSLNDTLDIVIFWNDCGKVPHFHIIDRATYGGVFHTCVKLESPEYYHYTGEDYEYFHHDGEEGLLTSEQCQLLIDALNEDPHEGWTNWKFLLHTWNINNPDKVVDVRMAIPDYTQLTLSPLITKVPLT